MDIWNPRTKKWEQDNKIWNPQKKEWENNGIWNPDTHKWESNKNNTSLFAKGTSDLAPTPPRIDTGLDFSGLTNDGYKSYLDNIKGNTTEKKQVEWLNEQYKNLSSMQDKNVRQHISVLNAYDNGTGKRYASDATKASKALQKLGYSAEEISGMIDTYKREANAKRTMDMSKKVDKDTDTLGGSIGHSIGSVGANLVSGLGFFENAKSVIQEAITGEYTPIDTNAAGYFEGSYRDTVRGDVAQEILGKDQSLSRKALSSVYQAGMSMTDSMVARGIQALTGLPATAILGAAAGSGTSKDTFERTGSANKAMITGIGSGVIEAATEAASLGNLWDIYKHSGKAATKSAVANILAQIGIEGSEETTSEILNRIMDDFVNKDKSEYNQNVKQYVAGGMSQKEAEKHASTDFWKQVVNSFVVGGIAGGMGAGVATVANKVAGNTLSTNEKKVMNKEVENRIAEQEKDGKKLTTKEKNAIKDSVRQDLEKGRISIDTIESALGGDTYSSYKNLSDEMEEYTRLNKMKAMELTGEESDRLAELKEKNKKASYESEKTRLKDQLAKEVFGLTGKDRFLQESYNEKGRRSQAFEADLSKYDAKQQSTIQKAIDSKILNNTNRTHEFVDMIAKISADKGVSFDFTDNQRLKESGFALQGKTVNGYVKDGNITLNINSAKALNKVVGHEITHILEGTEHYQELQKAIFEYAKSKNDYDGRLKNLKELYKDIENTDVEKELTADLIGDYLFSDEKFAQQLSTKNRNIFQKIYDEIKYLVKTVTAGTKEAKELQKVKKIFDKAYTETTRKSNSNDNITKYSLFLSEEDLSQYLKAGTRANKNRQKRYESGEQMIISSDSEFESFIRKSIEGNPDNMVAYGMVEEKLAQQVETISNQEINISDAYLELLSNDVQHTYNEHVVAKEDGDLDMSAEDLMYALKHVNQGEVVNANKYKNGGQRITIAIPVADGKMILVELASKSAGSLRLKTGWKVTNAKFEQNYKSSSNSAGNKSSIDSVRDDAAYIDSISQNRRKETQNQEKYSISKTLGNDIAPVGNWNIKGEDIALEDIGPVREDVAPAQEVSEGTTNEDDAAVRRYERKKQRINEFLELDKQKLEEELEQKKAQALKDLGDRDTYVSIKAYELYNELANLRKGVRASKELGYLLDFGYEWKDLKTALLNTRAKPNATVNRNSGIESIVRESIGRDYDARLEEISYMDIEYSGRIKELENDAKRELEALTESHERIKRAELHASIINTVKQKFTEGGLDFDAALANAKDKSAFLSVDNTPQRFVEKTLGYKEGQILNDLTVNQTAQNESKAIKWLNSFTDRKNGVLAQISKQYGIKPKSKESAAAQMYGEGFWVNEAGEYVEYGDAELLKDFPDPEVRKNIKGLANDPRIRKIYDDTLNSINESRKRNGYPEITRRNDYFLHYRAMDDTFSRLGVPFNPNDIRAKDLPTDLNGVTADLKPGQPYFASAMQRKGKRTTYDLLGGLEQYLTNAKNQIYHIDDIQTMRALRNYVADMFGQAKGFEGLDELEPGQVKDRLEQICNSHLSTFAKFLNEQANTLAGKTTLIDRGLEGVIGRRGITFLDTVNKQVGSNMVGMNLSSSLTNLVSVVQGYAKANKFDATKAFIQTAAERVNSIFGRSDGFAEQNPLIIRRKGAEKFTRTPYETAKDAGYLIAGAIDNFSTEFIVRAKYNELTRKGMNEYKAHIEADKWASRILGDRSYGQQPHLYNSKMLGLITKFQLEVRNQLDSMFYDTIQEAKLSNEEIQAGLERNARVSAKVASTFLQLAVGQHIFGQVFESIAGYNPAFDIIEVLIKTLGFDDEEDSEDTIGDNLEQGFLALMEDLPYTSIFTGGRVPIASALPIKEVITGMDSYGNEKSRLETIGEALPYYLLPTGYGQIKKTAQGLKMFDDDLPIAGSYTKNGVWDNLKGDAPGNLRFSVEDTVPNRLQAAVFGQYANQNAQDYFDRGEAPLKEKQIQELKDLDIPIQEYWDYREVLKELKTNEEKADYIASLNLPTRKKNIMVNNAIIRDEDIDMTNYDDFGSLEEFDFATKKPEQYAVAKAVGGFEAYQWYKDGLSRLKADKDQKGKDINGSKKEKVITYLNNIDADYGAKLILYKNKYPSDDTYNSEIVEYLNNRSDISYNDMVTILTELGFTVEADGTVRW